MHCKQKTTTEKYKKDTCVLPKEHLSTYKRIHFIRQKGTFQKAKGCLLRYKKGTYHAAKRHILKRKTDMIKA